MRKVSVATREELVQAVRGRYGSARRPEKAQILNEFVAVTGFHRKHAMRLLRAQAVPEDGAKARPKRQIYDETVSATLVILWEASDRVCGKRLKAAIPELLGAMERHAHLQLEAKPRELLLKMSAATIDRTLRQAKGSVNRRRGKTARPAIRKAIPVRTFSDWGDPAPGFFEADLVWHSGPTARGSFVQTLVLTDIATGWTEFAPLLVREQKLLTQVLSEIRKRLPFELLGFDTDNDSVFINETVEQYCRTDGIVFTRCRPYRKNDQAFAEQKNGAVIRRLVGYRRLEGLAATVALAQFYAAARLFVNFFQPSFKLAEKSREGAKVHKRYHAPATPYQRLLNDERTPEEVKVRLRETYVQLDPVHLLRDMRAAQQQLSELSDQPAAAIVEAGVELDLFLASLRTAWTAGEANPMVKSKPKKARERRRPDPLVAVTADLKAWFEASPGRSGRELLDQLQAEHPGLYPDGLLRTVQRRLKIWRADRAKQLVFAGAMLPHMTAAATRMLGSGSGELGAALPEPNLQ